MSYKIVVIVLFMFLSSCYKRINTNHLNELNVIVTYNKYHYSFGGLLKVKQNYYLYVYPGGTLITQYCAGIYKGKWYIDKNKFYYNFHDTTNTIDTTLYIGLDIKSIEVLIMM
jgi:hypothetical protein